MNSSQIFQNYGFYNVHLPKNVGLFHDPQETRLLGKKRKYSSEDGRAAAENVEHSWNDWANFGETRRREAVEEALEVMQSPELQEVVTEGAVIDALDGMENSELQEQEENDNYDITQFLA